MQCVLNVQYYPPELHDEKHGIDIGKLNLFDNILSVLAKGQILHSLLSHFK